MTDEKILWLHKEHFHHTYLQNMGFGPLLTRVLAARFSSAEEAYDFLSSFKFTAPFLIPGMKEAAELIMKAAANNVPILVAGDYDADGVCGTAILVRSLREYNADVSWYLPTRADGYGFNLKAVEAAAGRQCGVIIAVDCGTNDDEAVRAARQKGMEVVVVDHHMPGGQTVPANVIVNPHLSGGELLFNGYCGAGLAYKLTEALAVLNNRRLPDDSVIMAGIATCADVMPLVHENRLLVKKALEFWPHSNMPGIAALREVTGITYPTARQFSWVIGPILNAPGRLDTPYPALELLLSDNKDRAQELAEQLVRTNRQRQEETEAAEKKLLLSIPEHPGRAIVSSDEIPVGLAGLLAGRLARRYCRPAIVLAEEGDVWRGSGRSPEGINILEALRQGEEYLERLGGHSAAVGLSIRPEKVEALKELLERLLPPPGPSITDVDAVITLPQLRAEWVSELSLLEPYGEGNPQPIFMLRGISPQTYRTSTGEHLQLKTGDKRLIWFQAPPDAEQMSLPWDLAVTLSLSDRMGYPEVQAVVEHAATSIRLSRETVAHLYTFLRKRDKQILAHIPRKALNPALAVLRELNLVDFRGGTPVAAESKEKQNLDSSGIYRAYAG